MDILFWLHSSVRWLVVLVALIAAIKFAAGWARRAHAEKVDRALMSAFSGLIDLQVALGVVYLLVQGIFSLQRIEHTVTMFVVAIVAHLPLRWRTRTDTNVLRNNLIVVIAVILLIIAGIASLPGSRWFLRGL